MDEEKRTVKILISFISDGDAVPVEEIIPVERPTKAAEPVQPKSRWEHFLAFLGLERDEPQVEPPVVEMKKAFYTYDNSGSRSKFPLAVSVEGIPEEGGLIKIARQEKPDYILAFGTAEEGYRRIAEDNITYIENHVEELNVCKMTYTPLLDVDNSSDFEQLRASVPNYVNAALEALKAELETSQPDVEHVYELSFNASSGTPQMTTELYAAVNFKQIPARGLKLIAEEELRDRIHFYSAIRWRFTGLKATCSAIAELRKKETVNFKLDFLSEASAFERLRDAAAKYDFILIEDRCRELWENRSGDGKALAFVLWRVSHAAQLADQMNFGENINAETAPGDFEHESAVSVMNHLQKYLKNGDGKDLKNRPELKDLLEWTKDYRKLLSTLVRSQSRKEKHEVVAEDESNLMELYLNIHRCLTRREYTDVLARYYRLVEGIMYLVLRKRHSFDARNPAATNLRSRGEYSKLLDTYTDLFSEELDKYHSSEKEDKVFEDEFYPKQGKVSLGFYASYKLLRCYDQLRCDPSSYPRERPDFGERFFNSSLLTEKSIVSDGKKFTVVEKMDEIRKQRNGTIAAHGMSPVEREDAEEAYSVLTALMRRMYQMNYIGNPDADPIMSALHLRSFIDVLEKV